MVTDGVANALLALDEGTVPLATAGLMEPKPVAARTTVLPGDAFTMTVFARIGASIPPCAENKPTSDVTTLIRKGALVKVPAVTVIFNEGTPAGISKGTCTFTWVGLT